MKGRERNSKFFNEATNKSKNLPSKNFLRLARETGQVNLSNRSLNTFPIELCSFDEQLEADENFWEINPITKIDLCHNAISVLPDEIERLAESLQNLKLRDNSLFRIPDTLFVCTALKTLDIAMNKLESLSPTIVNLSELRELFVFSNSLTSLPDSVCGCHMLQVMEAQDNKLTQLPRGFFFPSLLRLNIGFNNLTSLPDCLGDIVTLNFLDVKRNALTRLPDLSKLEKLSFLDASDNNIDAFPVLPSPRCSMARLNLGNNKLTSLDMHSLLSQRSSLSELLLNDNNISEIPVQIGLLHLCKLMDFSNNNLTDVVASIGYMDALQRLNVEGNPIRCIRRTLLTQSTADLKKYLKTRGPPAPAIDDPSAGPTPGGAGTRGGGSSGGGGGRGGSNLKAGVGGGMSFDPDEHYSEEDELDYRVRSLASGVLDLAKVGFGDPPAGQRVPPAAAPSFTPLIHKLQMSHAFDEATGTIAGVTSLNVSENKLTVLPYDLLNELPVLKILIASSNRLGFGTGSTSGSGAAYGSGTGTGGGGGGSGLPLPPEWGGSRLPASLRRLDVSKNKLTSALLASCLEGLRLVELLASNNALDAVPMAVTWQTNLRELQLSNNQIKSLVGMDFSKLGNLEILDLSSNNLSDATPLVRLSPKITSISLDNNSIRDIPLQFGLFPKLNHLGLYGNPQKTIRTHMLGNTDAILLFLRNRMPEGGAPLGAGVMTSSPDREVAPVPPPRVVAAPPARRVQEQREEGLGAERERESSVSAGREGRREDSGARAPMPRGQGQGRAFESEPNGAYRRVGRSEQEQGVDYGRDQDYAPIRGRGGGAVAYTQRREVGPEPGYPAMGSRGDEFSDRDRDRWEGDGYRAGGSGGPRAQGGALPSSTSSHHRPQQQQQQQQQQRQQMVYDRSETQQDGRPSSGAMSSAGGAGAGAGLGLGLQELRAEVAALERELDEVAISITRKGQLRRTLALKRAALLKAEKGL